MAAKNSPKKDNLIEVTGQKFSSNIKESVSVPETPRSRWENPVDQVMAINRRLVTQIETLKLKIEIDARQHEQSLANITSRCESKIQVRELEIENLKQDIYKKEEKIKEFVQSNKEKQTQIVDLENCIDDLKEDAENSKVHVDEIENHLKEIREETAKLKSGDAYSSNDEEIQKLQTEVDLLKKNLAALEQELVQAKKTICKQGGKLRQADFDRTNAQVQFREEISQVSYKMRHEVERIREVMKQQYDEMRLLREQNEDMRSDLREIKDILTGFTNNINASKSKQSTTNPFLPHPAASNYSAFLVPNPLACKNRNKK